MLYPSPFLFSQRPYMVLPDLLSSPLGAGKVQGWLQFCSFGPAHVSVAPWEDVVCWSWLLTLLHIPAASGTHALPRHLFLAPVSP